MQNGQKWIPATTSIPPHHCSLTILKTQPYFPNNFIKKEKKNAIAISDARPKHTHPSTNSTRLTKANVRRLKNLIRIGHSLWDPSIFKISFFSYCAVEKNIRGTNPPPIRLWDESGLSATEVRRGATRRSLRASS